MANEPLVALRNEDVARDWAVDAVDADGKPLLSERQWANLSPWWAWMTLLTHEEMPTSRQHRALALTLLTFSRATSATVNPAQRTIAARAGYTNVKSVRGYLDEMEAAGWLLQVKGVAGGPSGTYYPMVPTRDPRPKGRKTTLPKGRESTHSEEPKGRSSSSKGNSGPPKGRFWPPKGSDSYPEGIEGIEGQEGAHAPNGPEADGAAREPQPISHAVKAEQERIRQTLRRTP